MAEEIIRSNQSGEVTMRIWRGDEEGGEFTEYVMPAQEARSSSRHPPCQCLRGPRPGCRWNCKGRQVWLLLRRDHGRPSLMS